MPRKMTYQVRATDRVYTNKSGIQKQTHIKEHTVRRSPKPKSPKMK